MRKNRQVAVAQKESSASEVEASVALGDLLSSGLYERLNLKERLYVSLLTHRQDLLAQEGFSTMQAMAVLPDAWAERIFRRWFLDAANEGLGLLYSEDLDGEANVIIDLLH